MNSVRQPSLQRVDFQSPSSAAVEPAPECRGRKARLTQAVPTHPKPGNEQMVCPGGEGVHQLRALWLASLAAFDFLGIGLALCRVSTEVIVKNRTADDILQNADALQLSTTGNLCTTRPCEPCLSALFETVAHALEKGDTARQDAALSLRRKSRRRSLTLYVRAIQSPGKESVTPNITVLVMMLDSTIPVKARESDLYHLYGLTPTEARLSNLLMEGKTLEECCVELEIRHSTACSHLKRLFKKTGVHRQSQLVSLLLKSVGLLRLSREAGGPWLRETGAAEAAPLKTALMQPIHS
jgi:DNA-binding CsgD family transcriptional regulator